MNHSTIVISIIIGLLLIGSAALAFAEHDYFEPQWFWDSNPTLCLVDIPAGDLYMVLRASTSWERVLKDYNGGIGFGYNIIVVEAGEMADCNGYLHFSKNFKPNPFTGLTPIGLTNCMMATDVCSLSIDREYNDGKGYYDTIVHEVGHFLGLGHRLSYQNEGIIAVFLSNDVMMPVAKPLVNISKESIDALIWFNHDQRFINYTLPHNNVWGTK